MPLPLTPTAERAYWNLARTSDPDAPLPFPLTPSALPRALAELSRTIRWRLEHPELVDSTSPWARRWDSADAQLQQELAHHVRTVRVPLPDPAAGGA